MALLDDEVRATFTAIRWSDNDGKPYCPKCGCLWTQRLHSSVQRHVGHHLRFA